jgi:small GTP-binding protein
MNSAQNTKNIAFYGIGAVGKTNIINRLMNCDFEPKYIGTTKTSKLNFCLDDCDVTVLDTSGTSTEVKPVADVAVVVYANDNHASYKTFLGNAIDTIKSLRDKKPDIKIVLVCNKSDIPHHRKNPSSISEMDDVLRVLKVRVSAKTGAGIDELKCLIKTI